MIPLTRSSIFACATLVALSAPFAHAGDNAATGQANASTAIGKPTDPRALQHLASGNKMYNVRAFAEAVAEYKAGAVIDPAAIFQYNLGQCYRQLGEYKDAIWHYRQFVKMSPGATVHVDAARKFIDQMSAELEKKAMSEPPTEVASTTTAPAEKPTGQLQADEGTITAAWYEDRLGLGFSAAGLVGIAVGVGFLVNAASVRDDANAASSQAERESLFARADDRSTIGLVASLGGGALLAAGIITFAIPNERPRGSVVTLGASSSGIFVRGRF